MYWRNLMYHMLLDDPIKIEQLLTQFSMVGTHRRARQRMPDSLLVDWHFSGTFWWFRHDRFFEKNRNWQALPATGWAVEACPGILFKRNECCCLIKDNVKNAYHPREYAAHERFPDPPDP
jgi:hypothetical protein